MRATGLPIRLAAAAAEMSGPACWPSRRNNFAAAGVRAWYDQENTVRTSVRGSPLESAPSAARLSRNSSASMASEKLG